MIRFNKSLDNWDVSNVKFMSYMFLEAALFNQPINNWNVSNVLNMEQMFKFCESFAQPLNLWDIRVNNMDNMFSILL